MPTDSERDTATIFDLDEWLASVDGHTVRLTGDGMVPDGLGAPMPPGFEVGPSHSYCARCDAVMELVCTEPDEYVGHCVRCGRTPGCLELGIDSPADVHDLEEIPDYWPDPDPDTTLEREGT